MHRNLNIFESFEIRNNTRNNWQAGELSSLDSAAFGSASNPDLVTSGSLLLLQIPTLLLVLVIIPFAVPVRGIAFVVVVVVAAAAAAAIVARCFVRRIVRELVKSRKGELARAIVTSIALVNAPLTRTSGQTRKIYRLRAGKTTTRCTRLPVNFRVTLNRAGIMCLVQTSAKVSRCERAPILARLVLSLFASFFSLFSSFCSPLPFTVIIRRLNRRYAAKERNEMIVECGLLTRP